DTVALLGVERPVAPRRPGHASVRPGLGNALDDRDELHEPCAALVPQEAVDLAAAVAVRGMDRRERVPLDASVAQRLEPAHHLVERPLAALVHPVRVVDLPWAVDRKADEEVVLAEERCPLGVEERAVRLDRVDRTLPGLEAVVRDLDRAPE